MDRYYEALHVRLHAEAAGEDLCVTVSGGDRPHIGCVAIAEPRPSLTGDGSRSATVSVINFPGHKDDAVAAPLARDLAAGLGRRAVVACGLHYDAVSPELFRAVEALTETMRGALAEAYPPLPAPAEPAEGTAGQ